MSKREYQVTYHRQGYIRFTETITVEAESMAEAIEEANGLRGMYYSIDVIRDDTEITDTEVSS